MNIFKLSNPVARQTRHLVISLLTATVLLSACQKSDSFSDNDSTSSDITPSYVEDIDDALAEDGKAHVNAISVSSNADTCQNDRVVAAFQAQQSGQQVKGCGTIITALPDDNEGSRHQKILIQLDGISPKQTILLVHNIDLAPRVADVSKGTALSFYGEYVYNDKGGLVHWTHHDPAARHQGGWIDSNAVRYQ